MPDSKPKWRPGPYRTDGMLIRVGNEHIATVHRIGPEQKAIADLFAASPDLYAALERATADLKKSQYGWDFEFTLSQARAALLKANPRRDQEKNDVEG